MEHSLSGRSEPGLGSLRQFAGSEPEAQISQLSTVAQKPKEDRNTEFSPRLLHIYHSQNDNDTELNRRMASRLYDKYSASQDYYYSTLVNNILSDAQTAGTVAYFDVLTLVDTDEYLKRYYALEEYGGKIRPLTEYYKFHRDIPRIFSVPEFITLNKYYDAKRKFEYKRIRKLLAEEAAKKNKRVAMNEDDNEIRLTDGEINPDGANEAADPELPGDEEESDGEEESHLEHDRSRESRVLPTGLIQSLYKDDSRFGRPYHSQYPQRYRYYMKEESQSTIQGLHDLLKRQHIEGSFVSDLSITQPIQSPDDSPFKLGAHNLGNGPKVGLRIQANRLVERSDLIASNSSLKGGMRGSTTETLFSADQRQVNQILYPALLGKGKSHRATLTDRGLLKNEIPYHEEYLGIGAHGLPKSDANMGPTTHRSQASLKAKASSKVLLSEAMKSLPDGGTQRLGTIGRIGTSAGKAKELQLNINLNLRVLRDENAVNSARGEYVCFTAGAKPANYKRRAASKRTDNQQLEKVNEAHQERLITRESVGTRENFNPNWLTEANRMTNKKLKGFGKKSKPEEVRPGSKDNSKGFSSKDRRPDSEDAHHQTDAKLHPFPLQIHNLQRNLGHGSMSSREHYRLIEEKRLGGAKTKLMDKKPGVRPRMEPMSPGKDKSTAKGLSKQRIRVQTDYNKGIAQATFGKSASIIDGRIGGRLTGNFQFTESTGSLHQGMKSSSKKNRRPSSSSKKQPQLNFKHKKLSLQQTNQPYGVFPGALGSYYAGAGDLWFGAIPHGSRQSHSKEASSRKRLKNSMQGFSKLRPNTSSGNLEPLTDRNYGRERDSDAKELFLLGKGKIKDATSDSASALHQKPVYQNDCTQVHKSSLIGATITQATAANSMQGGVNVQGHSIVGAPSSTPAHLINLQASALSRVLQHQPANHQVMTRFNEHTSSKAYQEGVRLLGSGLSTNPYAETDTGKVSKDMSLTPPLGVNKLSLSHSFGAHQQFGLNKPSGAGNLQFSARTLTQGAHGKSQPTGLGLDQDSKASTSHSKPLGKQPSPPRRPEAATPPLRPRSSRPQPAEGQHAGTRAHLIQGSKFTRVVVGGLDSDKRSALASKGLSSHLGEEPPRTKKNSPFPRQKSKDSGDVGLLAKPKAKTAGRRKGEWFGPLGELAAGAARPALQNLSKVKVNNATLASTSAGTLGVQAATGTTQGGSADKNHLMIAHSYSKSESRPGLFQLGYPGVSSTAAKLLAPSVCFSGPETIVVGPGIPSNMGNLRKKTHSSSLSTNLRNTSSGAPIGSLPVTSQPLTARKDK